PFRNLAQDPEAAFYEFSLADGVITELGQLGSLVVRPSSYVAPYVGQNPDPQQVGRDLAVGLVLTGSFARSEGRFRVNAQLLHAESGEIQWSERIDIPGSDLITVQDRIVERVIAGLPLGVPPEEQARLDELPTRSNEAYEFYLKGRDRLFRYISASL